ncbi:hypothetical protein DPEC_G00026330 [Dallia pectoralis]|uniref:Uncharacterized protein n=1 Tax=Dallia pectoralis TaxID=75939 RepID=A0ACC2HJ04_DALPE|nr:hypothetical protein DPEC_G00026330 [Dallia pectoralis]
MFQTSPVAPEGQRLPLKHASLSISVIRKRHVKWRDKNIDMSPLSRGLIVAMYGTTRAATCDVSTDCVSSLLLTSPRSRESGPRLSNETTAAWCSKSCRFNVT